MHAIGANHLQRGFAPDLRCAETGAFRPSWVPPENLIMPVTRLRTAGGTSQGLGMGGFGNLAPRTPSSKELRLLPRISGSTFGGTEGFRPGPEEFERLPGQAGAQPGSGEAAGPHSRRASPAGPQPRCGALGSTSENKALWFQPKVKVHRERVFPPLRNLRAIAFLQISRQ
ncbi:uncharacterized protein LOC115898240 [Rhinopithecus roxellana]|uniref:uncharacterized protein LOC115898240 n=1 Tax=Rhinopithecus roxellana TaxID=61622 RepID=UPI0012378ACE|nr:uncharacterized protein LOC115898240 [Rhinopithecus roxellana]